MPSRLAARRRWPPTSSSAARMTWVSTLRVASISVLGNSGTAGATPSMTRSPAWVRAPARSSLAAGVEVAGVDPVAGAQQHGALDDVLEFAAIARPGVARQAIERFRGREGEVHRAR